MQLTHAVACVVAPAGLPSTQPVPRPGISGTSHSPDDWGVTGSPCKAHEGLEGEAALHTEAGARLLLGGY